MAKKINNPAPSTGNKKPAAASFSTPVRNSPIPKVQVAAAVQPAKKSLLTHDQIAIRAYEIYISGKGGSQDDHWYQALRELNGH